MKPEFPVYEFLITDDDEDISGVNTFSLVSKPAMKSDFVKFSDTPMQKYIFIEKDAKKYKGIVAGIAMKPNELIPRVNDKGEKFYGYFSPETIDRIRTKFHSNPENLKSVNLEHSDKSFVNAFLVESYILDSQEMVNAVKAKGIKDATIGSWYTAFKIVDKDIFERCLKGEFNGFSVEAFLNMELSKNNFSVTNIEKKMKKTIIQKFKERLDSLIEEMSFKEALVPELNIKLTWGSVGDEVTKTYTDTEGNEKTEAVGTGEFVIEDGRTIVVDDKSALVEIREKAAEDMAKDEMPVEEKKEEEMPAELPVEEMPVSGDTKQEEMKEYPWEQCMLDRKADGYDEETAKKICGKIKAENMTEEDAAASLGIECLGCKKKKPEEEEEMAKEEMPVEEEKPVEEMPVLSGETKTEDEVVEEVDEEEFAPDGNENACKHGGRSTDASGYCGGRGSADKSTGTYKKGSKKVEDKPEEAPKKDRKPEMSAAEAKTLAKKWNSEMIKGIPNNQKENDLYKKMLENEKNVADNRIMDIEDAITEEENYLKNNPDAPKDNLENLKKSLERAKENRGEIFSTFSSIVSEFEMQEENFAALQTENEALKAEVAALKVKLSEPIAEPKLKDVVASGEVKELSVYELVARRNGLPTV